MVNGPFVQATADGLRLRFETRTSDPLPVYIGTDCPTATTPTTDTVERTYRWPDIDGQLGLDHPDEPGSYTLQQVMFTDLAPGEWVSWAIPTGPDSEVIEGTFRAPPAAGEPFVVAFVGDTMSPKKEEVLPLMAGHSPDLFLHGGDIQYMSFPGDTWAAFFLAARDVLGSGLSLFTLGNHEYEGQDEETVLYERLLGGQGTADGNTTEWHATDYSGVRFISLSSEEDMSAATDSQLVWLEQRLAEVDADPNLAFSVVFFHRPIYTLAEHGPRLSARAALDAIFDAHDVPLVLTGHNHSYERFEVGSRTYVVDGGGGAVTYSVDVNVGNHPDDVPLRSFASASYGFTVLEFDGLGGIELVRFDLDDAEIDRATIR